MTQPKTAPAGLPGFPLQLVDAYLYQATVGRVEDSGAKMGDEPTLEVRTESLSIQEDDRVLVVVVGAKVGLVYRDGHRLEIDVATAGHFRSQNAITEAEGREFAENSALVLVYPYLRANAGELGRMTGLVVPALPTLDVSGTLEALRRRAGPHGPARARRRLAPDTAALTTS